jgi:exosome complex exonuclease RRP6
VSNSHVLPNLVAHFFPSRYVLQNHILFLIADQLPLNMASLVALFKTSTPTVIKRRAKELLSVITEAVKNNSSSEPTQLRVESQVIDNSIELRKDKVESQQAKIVIFDDGRKTLQKESEKQTMDIWGGLLSSSTQRIGVERHPFVVKATNSMASAMSCSMLFRSSMPSTPIPVTIHHRSLSTAISSLLGSKGDNLVTVKSSIVCTRRDADI